MSVSHKFGVSLFGLVLSVTLFKSAMAGESAEARGGTVSFSIDIQSIFDNRCVSCHNSETTRAGLDLTAGVSYANLVDHPTSDPCMTVAPDSVRVTPGDTQASMLWLKTRPDDARCGQPMPAGTSGLGIIAPDEFALIEQWIMQGAANN